MSADNWAVCPQCEKQDDTLTLREDYELGMDAEGCFHVEYSCFCKVCKFKWSFEKHDYVE